MSNPKMVIYGDSQGNLGISTLDKSSKKWCQISQKIHPNSIKSISLLNTNYLQNNTLSSYIASCSSLDSKIQISKILVQSTKTTEQISKMPLITKISPITSIDIKGTPTTLITNKNLLYVGNNNKNRHSLSIFQFDSKENKIRKKDSIKNAHLDKISTLCSPFDNVLYSGSWDHSFKFIFK